MVEAGEMQSEYATQIFRRYVINLLISNNSSSSNSATASAIAVA